MRAGWEAKRKRGSGRGRKINLFRGRQVVIYLSYQKERGGPCLEDNVIWSCPPLSSSMDLTSTSEVSRISERKRGEAGQWIGVQPDKKKQPSCHLNVEKQAEKEREERRRRGGWGKWSGLVTAEGSFCLCGFLCRTLCHQWFSQILNAALKNTHIHRNITLQGVSEAPRPPLVEVEGQSWGGGVESWGVGAGSVKQEQKEDLNDLLIRFCTRTKSSVFGLRSAGTAWDSTGETNLPAIVQTEPIRQKVTGGPDQL